MRLKCFRASFCNAAILCGGEVLDKGVEGAAGAGKACKGRWRAGPVCQPVSLWACGPVSASPQASPPATATCTLQNKSWREERNSKGLIYILMQTRSHPQLCLCSAHLCIQTNVLRNCKGQMDTVSSWRGDQREQGKSVRCCMKSGKGMILQQK